MQTIDGRPAFSATDLNNFLACDHLTTLDFSALRTGEKRPQRKSEQAELLSKLGEEHEAAYLRKLREDGLQITVIERSRNIAEGAAATIAAMESGADVIYQAAFFDGTWLGHADFLRRVDTPLPGAKWAWHYEVEDTKLARHTEPYFLLQLCYYSEHVARVQGASPVMMYVVLGDSTRHSFRHDDYAAYYRAIKARFLERFHNGALETYPQPLAHCGLCVWDDQCTARRTADDHLSLVANISRLQTARLSEAGIQTLEALGEAPLDARPHDIARSTFETIARQARLQLAQRRATAAGIATPCPAEILPIDEEHQPRGFALLPAPCEHDVFFDMEGDPYYDIHHGLEYLFGAYTHDDKQFRAFWGCDRERVPVSDRRAEKHAFEVFIDFIMERWAKYPDMHVYHYASYEKSALQHLCERHATREEEVATILRSQLLVDLYRVVRQSIAVGQPGYSIKRLEVYYQKRQSVAIKAGDESILRFEEWLRTRRDPGTRNDGILEDLARYNEQDCISTYGLREWLLALRAQAIAQSKREIPYFSGPVQIDDEKPRVDKHQAIKERLRAAIPSDFDIEDEGWERAPAAPLWMALHMMEYHWREKRPEWWRFYDRCEKYQEDPSSLLDDPESIYGITQIGEPEKSKDSLLHTLHFPLQQLKVSKGGCHDPGTKKPTGEFRGIREFDDHGELTLKRGPSRTAPLSDALIVMDFYPEEPLRTALARFAERLLDPAAPGPKFRAARDLMLKAAPRLRNRAPGSLLQPALATAESIAPLIDDLDDSYLFIQGPPGSGKTYTGARLIVSLLERGLTVGITANSHKAIHNLLNEIEQVADARKVVFSGIKKGSEDSEDSSYESLHGLIRTAPKFVLDGGVRLFAGTAWAFSSSDMNEKLDYLFIDEAGQVSLPNAIAAATSTKNVVLLGDPSQLPHVSHTSHPGNIGISVLDHLVGSEGETVAPDHGVLLTSTYRMHDAVCGFISNMMYQGRLVAASACNVQSVTSARLSGSGLRLIAVEHENNKQQSIEEAKRIAAEVESLLQGTLVDANGVTRAIEPADVIVVTPYNAQVRCIRKALNAIPACCDVRVGTVDKFQGQEAYVVFFSTAASSAQDAPRGIDFLFDRNRLNVAISRARALAVLVGSPQLLHAECKSIDQVRSMNSVFQFVEMAASQLPSAAAPA